MSAKRLMGLGILSLMLSGMQVYAQDVGVTVLVGTNGIGADYYNRNYPQPYASPYYVDNYSYGYNYPNYTNYNYPYNYYGNYYYSRPVYNKYYYYSSHPHYHYKDYHYRDHRK